MMRGPSHRPVLDDGLLLSRLAKLLADGFGREAWNFDRILETARENLTPPDHALYTALAAAILDADKVAHLDNFPRWRETTGQNSNGAPLTTTDGSTSTQVAAPESGR